MRALEPQDNTRTRLIAAAAALVAEGGIAAASARAIAALAGASASAINYNFGNIERLLLTVFEQGVDDTRTWLKTVAPQIAPLPHTPDGGAWALRHMLAAWTSDGRRLALTYQEAITAGAAPAAAWTRLWRDFWIDTTQAFGLTAMDGRVLHAFFEHEALYNLSAWSPALESAALADMVDHLANVWLKAPHRPSRDAIVLAERTAGTRPYGSVPPAAMRIAKAAAEVVEDKGLAGLTHRAVATRAGVTTGSVTHHFRSIEDLVAGAIRGQVQAMTEEAIERSNGPPPIDDLLTADILIAALRQHVTADTPSPAVIRRRRLFLAAVRREELALAGAVIRFSYGGTLRDSLGRIYGFSGGALVLQAGVLARLMASIWFACAGDEDPAAARLALFTGIEARFSAQAGAACNLGHTDVSDG
uniref:TetR/AcrR family transcriptional regulator n=1 Tax=uncultured Caulobacter sp. TaxID=158749 RepID=UPI0025D17C83|nr:TetR family transcriptional regulator [uncultured Caulobacter sp.]